MPIRRHHEHQIAVPFRAPDAVDEIGYLVARFNVKKLGHGFQAPRPAWPTAAPTTSLRAIGTPKRLGHLVQHPLQSRTLLGGILDLAAALVGEPHRHYVGG